MLEANSVMVHSEWEDTRFAAKEKDQWFIIMPMFSPENLKKYEERKVSQQSAAPLSSAPQTGPSEGAR